MNFKKKLRSALTSLLFMGALVSFGFASSACDSGGGSGDEDNPPPANGTYGSCPFYDNSVDCWLGGSGCSGAILECAPNQT